MHRTARPHPLRQSLTRVQISDDLDLDNILQELLELECQLGSEAGDQLVLGLPPLPKSNSSEPIATPSPLPSHDAFRSVQPTDHYQSLKQQQQQTSVSPDADSAFGDSSTECSSSGSNGSGISASSNAVLRTGVRFASSQQRGSEVSTVGSYQGSLDTLSPSNHQVSS